MKRRELVQIEVTVEPVLDLTDSAVRDDLGVTSEALVGDDDSDLEACLRIADWARANGYRAIMTLSAARNSERVLVIYLEGPARLLRMKEGQGRERIV